MICGFFFLPHALGKFTSREAAFGFFEKAGFRPAPLFGYAAMILEIVVGLCLLAGLLTRPVAWIGCLYLLVAAAAVVKVERKWLWHLGGCEYPLFWGLCCAVVALA